KPAPQTALITAELVRCLHEVGGLPKGVVNLLSEVGHEVAQHLVTSPEVDVISFTGSNATGQRIMAAAAPTMKKLSLELGGKAAFLENFASLIAETMEIVDEVVLCGGRPDGDLSRGFFLTPTLVAHRDTAAFFVQEEIFGPLVVIEKFEDETEAVARANHSEYG